jgi:hypothetical protein
MTEMQKAEIQARIKIGEYQWSMDTAMPSQVRFPERKTRDDGSQPTPAQCYRNDW